MDKKLGRPRSEETKKAILTASYELLIENGFKDITVEGIAKRAGVSKATIYKWWPNKAAVVIDGFFSITESALPIPNTGSTEEDLFLQVNNLAEFLTSTKGKVIAEIIAEGQFDKELAVGYRTWYFNPRRLISKQILERGIQRGDLKKELDIELCIDLFFSPIFYRLLITGEKIDSTFVRNLVSYVMKGMIT